MALRIAVIMKTDIVGSTLRFRAELAADLETLLREHQQLIAKCAEDHGGSILAGCGNTREIRVFPWSAGVWRTFGVRIYGFLLCCRARIMPRDKLLA